MDRTAYNGTFNEDGSPNWICSSCKVGHLRLAPNSLMSKWTKESTIAHQHEASDPEWVLMVFACVFECSTCKEPFSCTGTGRLHEVPCEDRNDYHQRYEARYSPKYFEPSLILMDLPANCPKSVLLKLDESFALFFADAGASLNCARAALEALLTELGIKRFEVKRGICSALSLHSRLALLPAEYQHIKELLMAVKWLGNAGSHHGNAPTRDDVLDAYALLEHVLSEIYNNPYMELSVLAKKVNSRKGPINR